MSVYAMHHMGREIGEVLGLGRAPQELQFLQLILRALIVFFATLMMIRFAGRRFLAQRNPFDVLLAFLMASMMSRAINGSAPFFGTLGAGLFIVGVYRALAWGACRSPLLGRWIKGEAEVVVKDGRMQKSIMNRNHVSENDLLEDLRLNAAVHEVHEVRLAHIERNGAISAQRKPQTFEIRVEENVQIVRVHLES